VRQAEMNLAAAFYATNEARSAFYPSITLSGTAGWTNVAGAITNPGKLLLEAVGSVTQPLFQNGRLRAELKIAKSQQEEAGLNFRQALLNAGMEVNNALTQVQTYRGKADYQHNQVTALERTVKSTRLLMENGSAGYLEVLTAQENLLSARLSYLQNRYDEIASFIALYQALGGGKD
jgi:outer membrane protein TolC